MKLLNRKQICQASLLILGALLNPTGTAWAETDKQLQEKALKAREMLHQGAMDHSAHSNSEASSGRFRGVFYGYLPCDEAKSVF